MPPKKKQKVAKPTSSASSSSPSKPASSSRSTRSRTRSASAAPPALPTKKSSSKKGKATKAVKAEPEDDPVHRKDADQSMEVWAGDQLPQVECWVEIPPMPKPSSKEDELMFFRPKSKKALKEKGKHKEYADSLVWHVDNEPVDAEPFHIAEEDLQEDDEAAHVVAVEPRASKAAKATNSDTINSANVNNNNGDHNGTPTARRTAAFLEEASQISQPQPTGETLEDMFLSSNEASTSRQGEHQDAAQLFFDDVSDKEHRLRNGTSAQSQSSQRSRVKQSPTYGDRIAQGSSRYSSRSPTPRAAAPATHSQRRTEQESSKDKGKGKERAKERDVAAKSSSTEKKKRARSVDSGSEPKSRKKKDDIKNLRSELNEDAFARSTGARHKEEYRNKLAAFAQARKKARQERGESISSSSDDTDDNVQQASKHRKRLGQNRRATTISSNSDSSDSDSDDSGRSSSSSEDAEDFIVGDDQVEYDEGFQPEEEEVASSSRGQSTQSQARSDSNVQGYERDSDGRIRLLPISGHGSAAESSSSVLAAHGLGAETRKGLDEMCLDWLEWAAARVLVTWSALSLPDRERLERNRAALKSRMRSIEESVESVAMRRQFKWYLRQYPIMEIEALFSDELGQYGTLAKNGCGVCHRKSQKAQFKITFSGERYNQEWLSPLRKHNGDSGSDSDSSDDSDSDAESDRSSDNETWREENIDSSDRATFTFFAGQHCAQRAAVLHKLHHWEWITMQTLARHDSIRFIRRLLWRKRKMGRGKDGQMGCGAWEVWLAVSEMVNPTGRCTWPGKEKERGKDKGKGSELDRLRRRLKGLSEQAIEVNRAR